MEQKELKEAVAPLGFDPAALYPLLRTFNGNAGVKPPGGGHPNIVLVIFESFGAFYVDSFHQGPGGPFGSTPRFDALARDGVRFSRFYANGSRSIEAIQNILTSFPAMRSLPTLGLGYEQTSISSLARLLREAGYHTLFAQSAARGSFRLDAIAGALGFQDYMGIEDYPRREVHRGQRGPQFGWDDEMFQGVAEKMQKMEEPFFIVMFTGSSHTPFAEHPPGINLRPGHGSDNEAGFLDMVAYSDQALGAFIDGLKRDVPGRFSRSVFAFTADHMFPPYRTFNIDQQFRVPFVLYAPGMLHAGEIQRIGSHLDILPTILALSGYRGGAATAGRPLMGSAGMEGTPEGNDFAFIAGSYGTPAIVTRQGILQHSLQQRLDSFFFDAAQCDHACLDDMEKRLLAYHQLLYQCFRLNRIQPDASGR